MERALSKFSRCWTIHLSFLFSYQLLLPLSSHCHSWCSYKIILFIFYSHCANDSAFPFVTQIYLCLCGLRLLLSICQLVINCVYSVLGSLSFLYMCVCLSVLQPIIKQKFEHTRRELSWTFECPNPNTHTDTDTHTLYTDIFSQLLGLQWIKVFTIESQRD